MQRLAKCRRCGATWELPEPHGGNCTKCPGKIPVEMIEVPVDAWGPKSWWVQSSHADQIEPPHLPATTWHPKDVDVAYHAFLKTVAPHTLDEGPFLPAWS